MNGSAKMMCKALAAGIVGIVLAGYAHAQTVKEQLVGAWSVASVAVTEPGGKKTEPFGPNPQGQFIFTADGHFATVIIRPGRGKFASNNRTAGTPEENKEAFQGNISVFGTYTVGADGTVSYHIIGSSFPNWDGTDQKRLAKITGDELAWTNPTASTGGCGDAEARQVIVCWQNS